MKLIYLSLGILFHFLCVEFAASQNYRLKSYLANSLAAKKNNHKHVNLNKKRERTFKLQNTVNDVTTTASSSSGAPTTVGSTSAASTTISSTTATTPTTTSLTGQTTRPIVINPYLYGFNQVAQAPPSYYSPSQPAYAHGYYQQPAYTQPSFYQSPNGFYSGANNFANPYGGYNKQDYHKSNKKYEEDEYDYENEDVEEEEDEEDNEKLSDKNIEAKLDAIESLIKKHEKKDDLDTQTIEDMLNNIQDQVVKKKLADALGIEVILSPQDKLLLSLYPELLLNIYQQHKIMPGYYHQQNGYKGSYHDDDDDDDNDEETEDAIKDLNIQLQSKLSIIEEKLNRLQDKVARNNIDGSLEEEEDKLKLIVDKLKRLEQRFNDEIPPPQPPRHPYNFMQVVNEPDNLADELKRLEEKLEKIHNNVNDNPHIHNILNNNQNRLADVSSRIGIRQKLIKKTEKDVDENYKNLEEKIEKIKELLQPSPSMINPANYASSTYYSNNLPVYGKAQAAANQPNPILINNQIDESLNEFEQTQRQINSQKIRINQRQKVIQRLNELREKEDEKIKSIDEKLKKIEDKLSKKSTRPIVYPHDHPIPINPYVLPVMNDQQPLATNLLPADIQQLILLQQILQQQQQNHQQSQQDSRLESKLETLQDLINDIDQNIIIKQVNSNKSQKHTNKNSTKNST